MAKIYHGVDILERTEITRTGEIVKVYRVSATTRSGVAFSIDISAQLFTKEQVDKQLTEKATELEAIKGL